MSIPYNALFSPSGRTRSPCPQLIILGATLLGSLFIERPWCKYFCPYGALLGVFNKFRIFKIKRSPSTCISCNKCTKACPMNIDVAKQGTITDLQCISCFECTSQRVCPVPDTVEMQLPMRRKATAAPAKEDVQ